MKKFLFFCCFAYSTTCSFAAFETIGLYTFGYTVSSGEARLYYILGSSPTTSLNFPGVLGGYPVTTIDITAPAATGGFDRKQLSSITAPSSALRITKVSFFTESAWYDNLPDGPVYLGNVLFDYKGVIPTQVSIRDDITSIEADIFSGATSLTSITWPSNLKYIGANAFLNCSGLTNVLFSAGLKTISSYAFSGCSRLLQITIPSATTSIGTYAFKDCSSVTSLSLLSPSLNIIESSAFRGCSSLTSVSLPAGIIEIKDSAFYGCTSLEKLVFNELIASVGSTAFYGCANLEQIIFPSSLASIASSAFSSCTKLKQVYSKPSLAPGGGTSSIFSSSPLIHVPQTFAGYTQPTWRGGIITNDLNDCPWIVFDSQGGSAVPPSYYPASQTFAKLPTPSRAEYVFLGWYTLPKAEGFRITELSIVPRTNSLSLFALWGRKQTMMGFSYTYYINAAGNVVLYNADLPAIEPLPNGTLTLPDQLGGLPLRVIGSYSLGNLTNLVSVSIPATVDSIKSRAFYSSTSLASVIFLGNAPATEESVFEGTSSSLCSLVDPSSSGWGVITEPELVFPYWPFGNWQRSLFFNGISNTVTFVGDNMAVSPESKAVISGSLYGELPIPTRDGFTFANWFVQNGQSSIFISSNSMVCVSTNHALSSRWSTNSYIVSYVPQGGSVSPLTKSVYYLNPYGTLPTPTFSGYTFIGWSLDSVGSSGVVDASTTVSNFNNHSIYALWTNREFTVTFNPEGGIVSPTTLPVRYNLTYGSMPIPTKQGYSFDGWWTATGGTGTRITESSVYLTLNNRTLYAKWNYPYSVSFDTQGGDLIQTPQTVILNQPYGSLPTPVFADARFLDWWTQANGYGTCVRSDTIVSNSQPHTLFAQWDINSVVGTTDLVWLAPNIIFWVPQAKTVHSGMLGMRSGQVSHSQSSFIETSVIGLCKVIYNWNVSCEPAYDYLVCETNGFQQARISGYNPLNPSQGIGWSQQIVEFASGTNTLRWTYKKDFADTFGLDSAWLDSVAVKKGYRLSFDAQSGTCTMLEKVVYSYETYGALPLPIREGFNFSGWWTAPSGDGSLVETNTVFNGKSDQTLFALWAPALTGFNAWLSSMGLHGEPLDLFVEDRNSDGIPNGIEYAFGNNLAQDDLLLDIHFMGGRCIVDTPAQDLATIPYVDVYVRGSTNLFDWNLNVSPVLDEPTKPIARSWFQPAQNYEKAFFKLDVRLK